jgi:UDP-3-O-[3-hydroxymyristoyl] glucosamine N-acyltransferase
VRHDLGYRSFRRSERGDEDDVEIGAHIRVSIVRRFGRTRIGRGTKLDNMVHVGHNCDIGERRR